MMREFIVSSLLFIVCFVEDSCQYNFNCPYISSFPFFISVLIENILIISNKLSQFNVFFAHLRTNNSHVIGFHRRKFKILSFTFDVLIS